MSQLRLRIHVKSLSFIRSTPSEEAFARIVCEGTGRCVFSYLHSVRSESFVSVVYLVLNVPAFTTEAGQQKVKILSNSFNSI